MDLPDFKKLVFEAALYEEFSLKELKDSSDINALFHYLNDFKNYDKHIDVFCVDCEKDSTFHRTYKFKISKDAFKIEETGNDEIFMLEFSCTRDNNHKLFFIFRIKNLILSKIGQHYSIADIKVEHIKKYKKVLGDDKYKEFSKSIGLISHGIGIGSFVYLRRIFEWLIVDAYKNNPVIIDEEEFFKLRMEEKIDLLKDYLPQFLFENKAIYSILSAGIHSLSENECLEHFDIIRVGIELILDEKIEIIKKKEKVELAKKSIANIKSHLKN